jgi:uncharacterized protein (TIGR02722 family)
MKFTTFAVLAAALVLSACQTNPRKPAETGVRYGDAKGVETTTNEFGSTDLQIIAENMAKKMLQSPVIANSNAVVRLRIEDVRNMTSEYIDTRMITNRIRRQLLNSGRVEFAVDDAGMQSQTDGLARQNNTGLYNSRTTARTGRMEAERYAVRGSIRSIVKRGANAKDVFYTFELSLTDRERGVEVWAEDQEIRKVSAR